VARKMSEAIRNILEIMALSRFLRAVVYLGRNFYFILI
jgi:hypothetical protein